VAENFRVLETLYPGRIDLGIGRAPGSDRITARALAHGPGSLGIEHFPAQIRDVIGWLHDTVEPGHPFVGVRAMPVGPTAPEVWLLGSSAESATYAAHFGTGFSFAHFINASGGDEITRMYRAYFRPSEWLAEPRTSIGAFVICADTEDEARRLARSRELSLARRYTGEPGPFPTVAEAEAHLWTTYELAIVEQARPRSVIGAPEQVREQLLALAADYEAEEVVIVTITEDEATRLRSYELLAEAFDLPGRQPLDEGADLLSS
jgi:luciferase family oxidoreductase group 1